LLSNFFKFATGNSCSGLGGSGLAGDSGAILTSGGNEDCGGARDAPRSERTPSGTVAGLLWFTELGFDGSVAPISMLDSVGSGDGSGRIGEYVRGSETGGNE
jgi:hypothetical protein